MNCSGFLYVIEGPSYSQNVTKHQGKEERWERLPLQKDLYYYSSTLEIDQSPPVHIIAPSICCAAAKICLFCQLEIFHQQSSTIINNSINTYSINIKNVNTFYISIIESSTSFPQGLPSILPFVYAWAFLEKCQLKQASTNHPGQQEES